jgi:acetyl/propionyl-CoA carboxylase alpha subunit
MTGRELQWRSGNREFDVRIEEANGVGTFHFGDEAIPFVVRDRSTNGGWIEIHGRNLRFHVYRNRDECTVWIGGRTYRLTRVQKGAAAEDTPAGGSGEIRALMPGKILRIDVQTGDSVTEKQPIIVMESMKMENALAATRSGTIAAVQCTVGQVVQIGDLLVVIE